MKYNGTCSNSDQCRPLAGSDPTCESLECDVSAGQNNGVCTKINPNPPCHVNRCQNNKCVDAWTNRKPGCSPTEENNYCCVDKCTYDSDCINDFKPSSCVINGPAVIESTGSRPGMGDFTLVKNQSGGALLCGQPTYVNAHEYPWGKWTYCFDTQGCSGTVVGDTFGNSKIMVSCNNNTITCSKDVVFKKVKPTNTPVPTKPAGQCVKSKGDANDDKKIDLVDFAIWRDEVLGNKKTKKADFNCDGKVNLVDFAIWKDNKK